MRHLAANYRVLALPELFELVTRSGPVNLPPRSVLITFDDAYHDFADYAWPILKQYRLPATLFVPTAFPDQPERIFWWDWLYFAIISTPCQAALETSLGWLQLATPAQREQTFSQCRSYVKLLPHHEAMPWVEQLCRKLDVPRPVDNQVLSWDSLRQLAGEGVTLGAHTRTHPLLNRVSPDEAETEAVGSLRDLEREIGPSLPIFAYPSGGVSEAVVQRLAQAGFTLAFTTAPGINVWPAADLLRLRRINVNRRASLGVFQTKLLAWPTALPRLAGV
jgi:peptidoglycan/xylan/chitin deacetylase (PgdA/CDA1 family)